MSPVSVTASIVVGCLPATAFERFAAGEFFGVECAQLTVGAAVAVSLPLADTEQGITVLGHVAALRPGYSVVIVHHQPWSGRLLVRFKPVSDGTRILVEAQVDAPGIDWLVRRRGYSPPVPSSPNRHRIGLLLSKSGPAAVFAQAAEALARLAVHEVNADGGIGSTALDLQVGDDGSDALTGVREARRLVRSGAKAIFACVTSATFAAVTRALRGCDVLLVHTVLNEGGPSARNVVRLGERPAAQLRAGVPDLMADADAKRWLLVGQSYSWSYGAHAAARRIIADAGGTVVGERLHPLGTNDFGETIERIADSGAELVLSSLVGHDEVFFERQFAGSGLRSEIKTLALALDEATLQLIGSGAAEGIRVVLGYFQDIDDPANRLLGDRYRADGALLPPLSSLTETTYEAILAYARAANAARVEDVPVVASVFRSAVGGDADEHVVGARRLLGVPMYLAESRGGELRVQRRMDP